MKLFKKGRRSDVDGLNKEEKSSLGSLVSEQKDYLSRASEIDERIIELQKSTRTLVPAMIPVHNWLRMKIRWYYKWHLKPYSKGVHWVVLGVATSAIMLGVFFSISIPNINPVQRTVGATGCTTTKTGVWSDSSVWTGCLSSPPGIYDEATIANNVTLDTSATINSLTISNGITLDTTGTPTLDLGGQGATNPDFTNNGGTFTPGSSTVVLEPPGPGNFLTAGAITFNNLTVTPAIFMSDTTSTFGSGALIVNGNLVISATKVGATGGIKTLTVNMGANITVTGTTQITKTGSYAATKLDTTSAGHYTLTTGSLALDTGGTLLGQSSNINIVNSVAGPGTFTKGTSTVNFTGTATNNTINLASQFNNVVFNSSDGNGVWSAATNTFTVSGNLTMTSGTLNTANGTANVTVAGNITGAGTIDMTTAGTNTFTQSTGNTSKTFGTTSGTAQWKFYVLNLQAGMGNITVNTGGTGDITVNSVLLTGSTSINAGNRTWHLKGVNPIADIATNVIAGGTSTFSLEATSGTSTIPSENWNNLTFAPASGTPTFNLDYTAALCLLPGTKISTPNGDRNIEDLTKNDQVLSYNPSLHEIVIDKVISTNKTNTNSYYLINNKIKATSNHKFYIENDELKTVQDLRVGDILKTQTGTEIISTIEKISQSSDVYDISVENNHNFFADGYLVHNANTNGTLTVGGNLTLTGAGAATVSSAATKAFNLVVNGDMTIDSGHTFTIGTGSDSSPAALTVNGNWTNSGTFNPSTGTVTFSKSSSTQTLISGGTGAGKTFYKLNHSGAGILELSTNDVTVSSDFTNSAGTFNENDRNLNVTGNFSSTSTFNGNTGTVTLNGASPTLTMSGIFNNLTNNISGTLSIGAALSVAGTFTNTQGTFEQGTNHAITVGGSFLINGGTYTKGTGLLELTGSGVSIKGNGNNLGQLQAGASPSSFTLTSDLLVDSLVIPATDTLNTNGYEITIATSGITLGGTLDTTDNGEGDGSVITLPGDFTIQTGGVYTKSIATNKRSKIILNGSSGQNITSKSNLMGDIEISNTTGVTMLDALDVNNLTLDASAILNTGNFGMTIGGDWANGGVFNGGTSTVDFDGGVAQSLNSGGTTNGIFYNLTHSTSNTLTVSTNDIKVTNNLTLSGGTFIQSGKNISVTGSFANSGIYQGTGTVTFDGGAEAVQTLDSGGLSSNIYFNNVTHSGLGILRIVNNNIDIRGDFNNTYGTFDVTNVTIKAGGAWTNAATFTAGSSTVEFDGGSQVLTTGGTGTGKFFYNLTKSTAGTLTVSTNSLDVNGDITISAGTLALGDNDLYLAGNYTGTITQGTQTFYMDGTGTQTIASGTSLKNLTHTGSGLLTIAGNLTLSGNFVNSTGTFNQTAGTATFNSSSAQSITTGGAGSDHAFYNLTHSGAGDLTLVGDLYVSGNLVDSNDTSGVLNMGSSKIYVAGNWQYTPTEAAAGTSEVIFDGTTTEDHPFTVGVTSGAPAGYAYFYKMTFESTGTWVMHYNQITIKSNLVVNGSLTETTTEGTNLYGNMTGTGTIDFSAGNTITMWVNDTNGRTIGTAGNTNKWKFSAIFFYSDQATQQTINKVSENDIDVTGFLIFSDRIKFHIQDDSTETWTIYQKGLAFASSYAVAFSPTDAELSPGLSTFILNSNGLNSSYVSAGGNFHDLRVVNTTGQAYNLAPGVNGGILSPPPPMRSDLCLLGGTEVRTENGIKNIEDIKVGDKVISYDKTTKQNEVADVVKTNHTTTNNYYNINNKIKATGNHIFILSNGNSKRVNELRVGDELATSSGSEFIQSIENIKDNVPVYDISLNNNDLFYANSYLVHNAGGILKILNDFLVSRTGSASASFTGSGTDINGVIINGKLTVDSGTTYKVADGNTTVLGSVEIKSGGTLDNGTGTLNIQGDYTNNGTYTHGTGTLNFTGSTNQTISQGGVGVGYDFYNLNHSGTATLIAGTHIIINNNFTNTGGTFNLNGKDLTISGSWTNSASFTQGNGTVTFNGGAGVTQALDSGGVTTGKQFNTLVHSGTGTLRLANNNLYIAGKLTNSAGTFDANDMDIFDYGDWNFSGGQFLYGSSSSSQGVYLYGDADCNVTGDTTFKNLFIENQSATKNAFFNSGSTQTINGNLSLSGNLQLDLIPDSGVAQWNLALANDYEFDAPVKVSFSKVMDPHKIYAGTSATDGGNNTNWVFNWAGIKSSLSKIGDFSNSKINISSPATFRIDINDKEVGKYLVGKITITDLFGNVVKEIELNEKVTQPGSFEFKWNYQWWRVGIYKVKVTATYGGNSLAIDRETYLFIVPWWSILIFLLLILGLVFLVARWLAYNRLINKLAFAKYHNKGSKKEEPHKHSPPKSVD